MLLLDTDHQTLLERGSSQVVTLQMRLGRVAIEEVATSVVTYEEQMRGWLARSAQAITTAQMIVAYARLLTHIDTLMVAQTRLSW